MAEKSNSSKLPKSVKSQQAQAALGMRVTIPILRSEKSMFDNELNSMKRKFNNEMKRIDSEMSQFSSDLERLTGTTVAKHSDGTSLEMNNAPTSWNNITNSPLVEVEGNYRVLNLQFDVSQFHQDEIVVKIVNDVLTVTAVHHEDSNQSSIFHEFNRKFQLPKDTNPEAVMAYIDRDGVLTVKVPIPQEYPRM